MIKKHWIKLWVDILEDPDLAGLKPGERWAWVAILLISSKGEKEGVLDAQMTDKYIANESHLTSKAIQKVLKKMSKKIKSNPDGSKEIINYKKYQSESRTTEWRNRIKGKLIEPSLMDYVNKQVYGKKEKVKCNKKCNESVMPYKEEVYKEETDKEKIYKKETKTKTVAVLDYFNQKTGHDYRYETWKVQIGARLKEYTVDDIRFVIDFIARTWKDVDKSKYFTPMTVFRPANFERYINQAREFKRPDKSFDLVAEKNRIVDRLSDPYIEAKYPEEYAKFKIALVNIEKKLQEVTQ